MKIKFVDLSNEFKKNKNQLRKIFEKVGNSGQFVFGNELNKFEKNVSKFLGVKYAIGVGNWTEGMVIALKALNLNKDDEIITVSHSFIATVGAISYSGYKSKLVDIDETFNIDPSFLEQKITKKTKAIMPVHLTGMPCQIDKIKKLCKKYKLYLIEDAAQSFGAKYKNKFTGSFGDISIFSLHPRKNFHVYGDGGIITTNNQNLYKKILLLRNHGLLNRDIATTWGTNSRLDNLQAAFGNYYLRKINQINKKHREIANFYNNKLTNRVIKPEYDKTKYEPIFHQYVIRVKDRSKLIKYLSKNGIETGIHYPVPIHLQPCYKRKIMLKNTELFSKEILSLPIHPSLKKNELNYIVDKINHYYL